MSYIEFPWLRRRSQRIQARAMSDVPPPPALSSSPMDVPSAPCSTTSNAAPFPGLTDGVIRARYGAYVTLNGRTRLYGRYLRPTLDHESPDSDDEDSAGNYDPDPQDTHFIAWSECTTRFGWCFDEDDNLIDDPRNYSLFHAKDIFHHSRSVEKRIEDSVSVMETLVTDTFDQLVAASKDDNLSHKLEDVRDDLYAVLTEHRLVVAFALAEHRKFM